MMKIIFVCIENAARSQIAEVFAKKHGKEGFIISSAGIKPSDKVNPTVILVMKEKGIDISKKVPKLLTPKMIQDGDLIITMGCGAKEICVNKFSKPTVDWQLEDPKGKSIERVIEIRNEIELKVKELIQDYSDN